MIVKTTTQYTMTLTQEEIEILLGAIGSTSVCSRVDAGMTEDQSQFMSKFYHELSDVFDDTN
jgi:hypothetical protein